MSSMENCFEYNIVLSEPIDDEVMEWFEFMNSQGKLSGELVKLVAEYIKANNSFSSFANVPQSSCIETMSTQDDLFNSLYDCSEASGALFQEEKKPKKKMLSV